MAHFLGSALCHHTHLVPCASVFSQGPPSAETAAGSPLPLLDPEEVFFSLVQCQEWQCSVCLYNVCVMYRSAHSGSQTTVLKWPRGSCQPVGWSWSCLSWNVHQEGLQLRQLRSSPFHLGCCAGITRCKHLVLRA